jgi:hypothetical protein
MYFSGKLEIDPSKITRIAKIKPEKVFAKLVHALTLGASGKKVERETFTAMQILNDLKSSLTAMNINNVVRINVNNHDFYLDTKGVEDDLDIALDEAITLIDPLESETFNKIFMVLEHDETKQKYLVEISVVREHAVGEYPIQIKVNGLISDLKALPGESREAMQRRMEAIFRTQEDYEAFVRSQKAYFNDFLDKMEMSVKKFIQTDDIKKISSAKVIRPKEKVGSAGQIGRREEAEPVYHGYYAMNDFFFYSFMWSHMMHSHNIYVHDVDVVDDSGADIMSVGEEGFNAGDNNAINDEGDFEVPAEGDVSYHEGNEFTGDIEEAGVFDSGGLDTGSDDSSWLSGFGGDSDGGGWDSGDFGDFGGFD